MTEVYGSCECGKVTFVVCGELRPVVYCHCRQCRKTSGHFVAATACRLQDLELKDVSTLQWYVSSPDARRGFCGNCGGNLFWQPENDDRISIMAGCLDAPTGIRAVGHIFSEHCADYHTLSDGLPTYEGRGPDNLTVVGE